MRTFYANMEASVFFELWLVNRMFGPSMSQMLQIHMGTCLNEAKLYLEMHVSDHMSVGRCQSHVGSILANKGLNSVRFIAMLLNEMKQI